MWQYLPCIRLVMLYSTIVHHCASLCWLLLLFFCAFPNVLKGPRPGYVSNFGYTWQLSCAQYGVFPWDKFLGLFCIGRDKSISSSLKPWLQKASFTDNTPLFPLAVGAVWSACCYVCSSSSPLGREALARSCASWLVRTGHSMLSADTWNVTCLYERHHGTYTCKAAVADRRHLPV